MSDYDPDTRPTIACPNPKCGHSIIIPPLIGEMGDRHPKWTRVEPGTVIPAGQPYREENYGPGYHIAAREYDGKHLPFTVSDRRDFFIDSSWKSPLVLPTEACVIRAKVTSWDHPRILFGHPNPGEPEGMTFCRAIDGLSYKRDEIESFEVLWVDDPEGQA